jgi:hypothetical protein
MALGSHVISIKRPNLGYQKIFGFLKLNEDLLIDLLA